MNNIENDNIDCSIPCHFFIKQLSSCPTKPLDIFHPFNFTKSDFHELFMVLLSMTPYPCCFLILLISTYFKTTRSISVLMMVFIENFIVEILKNNLRDPRPNYKCNHQFGNPSNHTSFFTCIVFWFIIEEIFTPFKFQCKYKVYFYPLFIFYPFIIYSRYYLHYHSIEQIIYGFFLGIFVASFWYYLVTNIILKTNNPIKNFFINLKLKNTLTNDILINLNINNLDGETIENEELLQQYEEIIKKTKKLDKLKDDLHKITNNIKNMEFLKEQEKILKEKKNKFNNFNKNFNNEENKSANDLD